PRSPAATSTVTDIVTETLTLTKLLSPTTVTITLPASTITSTVTINSPTTVDITIDKTKLIEGFTTVMDRVTVLRSPATLTVTDFSTIYSLTTLEITTAEISILMSRVTVTDLATDLVTLTMFGSPTTVTITRTPSAQTVTLPASTVTATTIVLTVAPTCTSICPQLVGNPSFKLSSTGIEPWINTKDDPGVSLAVVLSSNIPGGSHSGKYSGAFQWDGPILLPGSPADAYQSISISNTCVGTYFFQAFVKTAANFCYFNVYDNDRGTPFTSTYISSLGASPPWIEVSATITLTSPHFNLVLELACSTADPIWVDDVTLTF
ncbi:hypothetical protein V1523DRAFT_449941, partial [Lipomyces doorenjongii]